MSTQYDDDLDALDDEFGPDFDDELGPVEGRAGAGLELVGGALFLVGCIPAAAVAKALIDGTNLGAEGLRGTAALAAGAAGWVGSWPALVIAVTIAFVGARMVLGALHTEPLRYVGGAFVSGLGLAAILSAVSIGAGGRLGDGTGGALAGGIGTWAGVLLGLAVIAASMWLAFSGGGGDFEDDLDAPERGSMGTSLKGAVAVSGAAVGAAIARLRSSGKSATSPRPERALRDRGKRRKRVSTQAPRRRDPKTLGDALSYNDNEGVSHDEAAALAPDDRTLAYMEDVWRRASDANTQPEPIPPSPYPEDVRLKGEIPTGAVPLQPKPFDSDSAARAEEKQLEEQAAKDAAPQPPLQPVEDPTYVRAEDPFAAPAADIAPFDFADELSAPQPLEPQAATSGDPFGAEGAPRPMSAEEIEALQSAAIREGSAGTGPRDLPVGVTPLPPQPPAVDPLAMSPGTTVEDYLEATAAMEAGTADTSAEALANLALQAGAMPAEVSMPPRPSWETADDAVEEPAPIPDVDPSGRWQRREGESDALDGVEAEAAGGEIPAAAAELLEVIENASPDPELDEFVAEFESLEAIEAAAAELAPAVEDDVLESSAAEGDVAGVEALVDAEVTAALALEPELEPESDSGTGAAAELEPEPEAALATDVAEEEVEDELEEEELEEAGELEDAEAEADEDAEEDDSEEEEAAEYEEEDSDDEAEDEDAEYEDEEAEYEDAEDDAEEEEAEEEAEEDVEDDESVAAEADEEEEVEYEYVDEDGNPIDPAELEDGEYEYVEVDAEDEDAEEDAEEEDDEEDDEEEDESDEEDDVAAEVEEDSEEGEEDDEYEVADEDEEVEEAEAEDETDAAASDADSTEAEVILEPQASGAAAGTASTLSTDASRLYEAGCVVVKEGRVAVSVLQREFEMEFDEACAVLDELQEQGLVGPYKGGKKREILLSLEDWEQRFVGTES